MIKHKDFICPECKGKKRITPNTPCYYNCEMGGTDCEGITDGVITNKEACKMCGTVLCPSCEGSGYKKTVTELISTDVPDGYEYSLERRFGGILFVKFIRKNINKDDNFPPFVYESPYKVKQKIILKCEACEGSGQESDNEISSINFGCENGEPCLVCNGTPRDNSKS